MNSIASTYPDFQALPRGIKRLLMTSETEFFNDAKPAAPNPASGKARVVTFPRAHLISLNWERSRALDFRSSQTAASA